MNLFQVQRFFSTLSLVLLLAFGMANTACTKKEETGTTGVTDKVTELSFEEQAAKGRSIYVANCLACHNADPSKDGSVGPAVQGTSLEVLTAKMLTGTYPPGYTAKRATNMMQKFPQLEAQLPFIHAYLNPPAMK